MSLHVIDATAAHGDSVYGGEIGLPSTMSGSCSLLLKFLRPLPLVYMRSPHWQYKAQSSASITCAG